MSEGRDVIVSECSDPVSSRGPLRMLEGLPGLLVSRQVILLSMLLANPMGMRGAVV